MSPFTVLVTAPSVSEQAQKLLRDAGAEIIFMKNPITEDALVAEFSRRKIDTVLLRGPTPFTPAVFATAKNLRIISKNGAGIDSLNLEAATAHGVAVMVANGANADAVAEHALTLMLCLTRDVPRFDRELRKGVWKDQRTLVRDFRGRSVGIVGYGNIGQRTARLASACGANVVIYSRSRVAVPEAMQWEESLERLLGRVDILSLHCPLNEQTSKLIGEKQFQLMQPGALIINTARGRIIDEPALVAALRSGHLAGAGLDTFAMEPATPDNPLFSLPNVICTPHIASATTGAAAQVGTIAANNIISYLRGEIFDAQNFLNPSVYKNDQRARI